ncbi:hypothetical protein [Bradyrhizobium sp. RT10b]
MPAPALQPTFVVLLLKLAATGVNVLPSAPPKPPTLIALTLPEVETRP